MDLEQLKKELFERLLAACDEIETVEQSKQKAVETVYAANNRYDVEKFKDGNIPAGGTLLSESPDSDAHIYGLDSQNRPCFSSSEHTSNRRLWKGFYKYSNGLVEYVEFDGKSEKPSQITRLNFEDGRKKSLQYLKINGGGFGKSYEGLSNKEAIGKLVASKYDLICRLELYQYDENRISVADCWSLIPGIGPSYYKQTYTYDESGNLKEIKQDFENGTSQYVFVEQPAELSFQELSDQVAAQIANAIAESISSSDIKSPIAIMQLSYQEVGNYEPFVTVITDEDQKTILENLPKDDLLEELFITGRQELNIDSSKFERLLTAFMNKVEESENYDLATNMIRKAAYLITTQKLTQKLNLSDDFIAFAVDWSLIPDDLPQMMLECGMTPERLKWWQSKGVLLPDE